VSELKEKKKGTAKVPTKVKATVAGKKLKGEVKAVNTIAISAVSPLPEEKPSKVMTIKSDYLKFDVKVPTKIVADEPKYKPQYKTAGAACADVVAKITEQEPGAFLDKNEKGVEAWAVQLPSRSMRLVDCGFSMQLPEGWKAECTARSGHASRGLIVCNAPGQIDEDYRGRVKVILGNVGKEIHKVRDGDRIGQVFPAPVFRFDWSDVDVLDPTERGEGGFGSTGVTDEVLGVVDNSLHQNYYDVKAA
jgi:dUTP pyrophosphatase